jgi:Subtilase family
MRTMTFGCTLHHLTATAVVLQYLSTSSGSLAATITNNEEFIVDQFWQSVDEETFTPNSSLEWLMEREERIKFSETSPSASLSDSLTTRSLLRTKQKEHVDDFHWPASNEETHRLLIRCKADQDQEDCVSGLFRKINRDRIKIVHNLKTIHAISIEVDSETRDTLFADDLELHRDFERTPLVWSEDPTEGEARHLQEGQQESWALKVVRAREVWDVFGVRGRGAKVCLLDTGVDASHEDFEDLSIDGYEGDEAVAPWYEDRRGHGTHITGIIAASDNNLGTV